METQTSTSPPPYGEKIDPALPPENLPNSRLILTLGILSIVFCWWHFISMVGIILGIVALVLARNEMLLFQSNPGRYTISSLNNVKTGRTCALIGLIISLIVFLFVTLLIIGIVSTLPFWGMIG